MQYHFKPLAIAIAAALQLFTLHSQLSTLHAATFPARCVRVTADQVVGEVKAPLIVEEWQTHDGGEGQLLSRVNRRKLVIAPGQQVSVSWPITNRYVHVTAGNAHVWRSPCVGGIARFGLFSASTGTLSVSAGGRDTVSASGALELAAPYPLPYGTSRQTGSFAADGSAIDVQLSRFVAASGATVRVAWTPVSASLSEAYVPLPSGGDLATNVTIAVTADLDGNGTYTPGEPFGACYMAYADYAAPSICLTRTHPSIMRVALASAVTHNDYDAQATDCDRRIVGYGAKELPDGVDSMPGPESVVRVRIALSSINNLGQLNTTYANLVAFDRRIDLTERPTIDETILLDSRTYLLGSGDLIGQASNLGISESGFIYENWRIVLGDGTVSSSVANNWLKTAFINYHESTRSAASPKTPVGTVFRDFPRIRWQHTSTAGYHTPYPGWYINVHSASSGGSTIYTQRLFSPCLDADGYYSATIPILPGARDSSGNLIAATNYWWSVTPIDAKFPSADSSATRRKFWLATE